MDLNIHDMDKKIEDPKILRKKSTIQTIVKFIQKLKKSLMLLQSSSQVKMNNLSN